MVKKTIKYKNWDGVEVVEDFYFNLTKAELVYMEAEEGGLRARLEHIINMSDTNEIIKFVRYLISKSYGVKSDDGRRFMKSPELSKEFEETAAYETFIDELILSDTPETNLINFMKGVLPQGLVDFDEVLNNALPAHT